MSQQITIAHVVEIAIKKSNILATKYMPLHIVARQTCFVNYFKNILMQYPLHTPVNVIELEYSNSVPCIKKISV